MTDKTIFIDQLAACYDQNTWFVSLKHAIEGLSEEQAQWKSVSGTNSIQEIMNHLNFYNERYLLRFKGEEVLSSKGDNNTTFHARKTSWHDTVENMESIFLSWREELHHSEDEKFTSVAYINDDEPWSSVLTHLFLHNTYHIGQILHIRKEQGSWDSARGVH